MVSFDVVSLFTSIPIQLALQVIQRKLHQDKTLIHRTNISITNLIKLLEFVLLNSFEQLVNTNANSRTTDVNNRANPADYTASSFVILPYIKGVTEKIYYRKKMLKYAKNLQIPFPNSSPNPKISHLLNKLMELCTKSVVRIVISCIMVKPIEHSLPG